MPIAYLLVSPPEQTSAIRIDGSPSDWTALGIPFYADTTDSPNAAVALTGYAATVADGELFLAARVAGGLFADPDASTGVYFFIDADGDASTGYRISGMGADVQVRVVGGGSSIENARVTMWDGPGGLDWSGWVGGSPTVGAIGGGFLETVVDATTAHLQPTYRVRVAATDYRGNATWSSVPFGASLGSLRIEQRPLGTSIAGEEAPILQVTFTAFGGPVAIREVRYARTPPGVRLIPRDVPAQVFPGQRVVATIGVDATALVPGTLVSVGVSDLEADRPYLLAGTEGRAYAGSPPPGHVADGIFDDWLSTDLRGDLRADGASPSTDIAEWATSASPSTFTFYVRVRGVALAGNPVAETAPVPSPHEAGEGPSAHVIERQRVSGEDALRVWIDTDPGAATGEWVDGIFADILVSVSGMEGRVTDARTYLYNGSWREGGVPLAFPSESRLEGGIELPFAVPADAPVVMEATSWSGTPDLAGDTVNRGTRGADTRGPPTWPPLATLPPDWQGGWIFQDDPYDPMVDPSLDIVTVGGGDAGPRGYIYVTMILRGGPVLANHSWWLYLDNNLPFGSHDYANDWLVEERPGEVCTYAWNATGSSWGVNGTGCDVSDTATDTDVGSAVRVPPFCPCVAFALERNDYPNLGQRPWVSAATDSVEDLDLRGNPDRTPFDAPGGCTDPAFDDCTTPFEIPEYPVAAIALAVPALFLLLRRRRRVGGRDLRNQGKMPRHL